jgi:endo-1,4-beta-xylanase
MTLLGLVVTTILGILAPHLPGVAAAAAITLREAAASRGVLIGSAVATGPLRDDAAYQAKLGTEFSTVTPEDDMKWARVEPVRGQYDFSGGDRLVEFAAAHGQTVRGHTLVWHHSLPAWLTSGGFTADQLRAILKAHIETMVTRYRGRVTIWDVVNEPLAEDGTLRPGFWLDNLGPGYLADSFRWARAADPTAKLYLNEYGTEGGTAKARGLFALVTGLKAQGVPLDGIGFQTHKLDTTRLSGLADTMRRFAALDLDVAVTELDVRMPLPANADRLARQADVYGRAVSACLAVPRCRSITTWGFTDAHSWVPNNYPGWGAATLFDEGLSEKAAFYRVLTTLTGWQRPATDPIGWWRLDDWSGTLATDASGSGRHASAGGAALGGAGRSPANAAFRGDGVSAEASTASGVLATQRSYTVSAWVSLSDKGGYRVIASQDGAVRSAFYLEYHPAFDRWAFIIPTADSAASGWQTLTSQAVPATGGWTHLAAVFDAGAGRMLLYVNGRLEASAPAVSWASSGAFHIGRSISGGWFAGGISDVRAYDRALGAAELAAMADPVAGLWSLGGHTGDESWFAGDGDPHPELIGWTADRAGRAGGALALGGAEAVDVPQPALYTNSSYTVSAWVKLGSTAGYRVVASQDGAARGAFYLEYHGDYRRWAFIIPTADARDTGWQTLLSTTAPAAGAWTHLAAVFDKAAGRMLLYINGRLEASAPAISWASTGAFHIGRSMDGALFTGAIDEVRAQARALSAGEIANLARM